MSHPPRHPLAQELDVIDRFVGAYAPQFEALIERMNATPSSETMGDCLRLCVETLHMLLSTQQRLAAVLRSSVGRLQPVRSAA